MFNVKAIENWNHLATVRFEEGMSSTQDVAKQLAHSGDTAFPALVLTAHQTAGRGRGANRWWSGEGALAFSLVLSEPAVISNRAGLFSLAVAAAVCHSIERHCFDTSGGSISCGIKWPNDVMVRGKKLAGVLIETGVDANGRRHLVVGVGINVNNPIRVAPPKVAASATSFFDETAHRADLTLLLGQVTSAITENVHRLGEHRGEPILEAVHARFVLRGRNVSVRVSGELVQGVCTGLADDGSICLRTVVGERRLHHGSIEEVRPPLDRSS